MRGRVWHSSRDQMTKMKGGSSLPASAGGERYDTNFPNNYTMNKHIPSQVQLDLVEELYLHPAPRLISPFRTYTPIDAKPRTAKAQGRNTVRP